MIGYTMMCEQAGPKHLVRDIALAEEAGFDFAVASDHYFPWLDSQGHAPIRLECARRFSARDRPHSTHDLVSHRGKHVDVESAKVSDRASPVEALIDRPTITGGGRRSVKGLASGLEHGAELELVLSSPS